MTGHAPRWVLEADRYHQKVLLLNPGRKLDLKTQCGKSVFPSVLSSSSLHFPKNVLGKLMGSLSRHLPCCACRCSDPRALLCPTTLSKHCKAKLLITMPCLVSPDLSVILRVSGVQGGPNFDR